MKTIKVISLVSFLFILAGMAYAKKTSVSALYVIHANSGKLVKYKHQYFLSLHNPSVSYFTDRPVRKAGRVDIRDFLSTWRQGSNSFAKDNPNATLAAGIDMKKNSKEYMEYVVLSQAVYQNKTGVLLFHIKPMKKGEKLQTGELQDTVLFIDGFSLGGGIFG